MWLEREQPQGNVEYKLKLVDVKPERLEELASQLKYRLEEGMGEAIYEIGVTDDGEIVGINSRELQKTIETLRKASEKVGAKITVIRKTNGKMGIAAEVLIRRTKEAGGFPIWLYIPVLGNVDSGKSSLVSVLISGQLDDGNGSAMTKVARYLHEIRSRRTSSVSSHPLGFDEHGNVINYNLTSPFDEAETFLNSSKIVDFVDLGGHERYFKTTLKGIMGHQPDYCIITVAANAGIKLMTIEHLKVVVGLKLPMIFVITKIDLAPQLVGKVISDIQSLVKLPKMNAIPFQVKNLDDAVVAAKVMPCGRVVPIFTVSNVTGQGLDLLLSFLNLLPPRSRWKEETGKQLLLYIDDIFNVRGVGPVVSGLILQGVVMENDHVRLGPFNDGSFRTVRVKSIHLNRTFVKCAIAGSDACLALAGVKVEELRKGMVISSVNSKSKAVREFEGEVFILHHPTTIRPGYQAVIHVHTVRQAAEFIKIYDKAVLRTGDRAKVRFGFLYYPECLFEGQKFVFREANAKGIGVITRTIA
jgi:elongation factor 1-alpha